MVCMSGVQRVFKTIPHSKVPTPPPCLTQYVNNIAGMELANAIATPARAIGLQTLVLCNAMRHVSI